MSGGLRRGTPRDDIGATPSGISENIVRATPCGVPEGNVETHLTGVTPSTREKIKGHLSALRSLVKEYNGQGNTSPIHLSFDDGEDRTRVQTVVTRKEIVDADLKRPFKEAMKTQLTQRIIEFDGPEFKMPTNIKLYDVTTDPEDHLSRASFKDPTEITKIVRKANETLVAFKERWIVEIVDEMMTRLNDFMRSKEVFASTELPKGETSEAFKKSTDQSVKGKTGSTGEGME
ncbi:hypothetical protein Tco_1024533 [Tanacetum coccineum]